MRVPHINEMASPTIETHLGLNNYLFDQQSLRQNKQMYFLDPTVASVP